MLDIFGGCILERAIHDLPPRRRPPALARDLATKAAAARSIQKAAPQTFLTRGIIIIIIQSIDRSMGKNVRKTKKFALTKRLLNPKDAKQQSHRPGTKALKNQFKTKENELKIKRIEAVASNMFCLYANCVPHITDCVIGELEKLGTKFRVALRVAKDPRFVKLPCMHKGTYADDCIVDRCRKHRCYVVATCDTDLKRRLRKIPGVPIMYLQNHKYSVERLPAAGNIGNAPRL